MQVGDSYTWTPMAFEGEASGERDKRLRRARSVTLKRKILRADTSTIQTM